MQQAILISLFVLFVHATTWEGMINHWVHRVAHSWPDWLKKPVFDCPICMAPYWGSLAFITGAVPVPHTLQGLATAIVILFAAGGLNAVLIYIIAPAKEELKDED